MADHTPPAPDWQPLRIVVRQLEDGSWAGTLTIGAEGFNLRAWGKTAGVLHGEVQPPDWAHEAFMRELVGKVQG